MKRLTSEREYKLMVETHQRRLKQGYESDISGNRYIRLAEYENTGLIPNEVEQLQKENAELKSRLEKSVEPPCKVGDIVYVDKKTLYDWYTFWEYKNYVKAKVIGIKITKKQKLINLKPITERTANTRYHEFYPFSAFGKTVFLTKEEAEQVLKEREAK